MNKKERKTEKNELIEAKLDAVIHSLEDLFILQALSLGVRREHIRSIIRVNTSRISRINKGVRQARRRPTASGDSAE